MSGPYDTGMTKLTSFNETGFALTTGDVRSVRVSAETYSTLFNIQLGCVVMHGDCCPYHVLLMGNACVFACPSCPSSAPLLLPSRARA